MGLGYRTENWGEFTAIADELRLFLEDNSVSDFSLRGQVRSIIGTYCIVSEKDPESLGNMEKVWMRTTLLRFINTYTDEEELGKIGSPEDREVMRKLGKRMEEVYAFVKDENNEVSKRSVDVQSVIERSQAVTGQPAEEKSLLDSYEIGESAVVGAEEPSAAQAVESIVQEAEQEVSAEPAAAEPEEELTPEEKAQEVLRRQGLL